MLHRNSINECQLKLRSAHALSHFPTAPAQSAVLDPTNQKCPYSSLFQDIPAFAGGEGGIKWRILYSLAPEHTPDNHSPSSRDERTLLRLAESRVGWSYPPAPIANLKSKIPLVRLLSPFVASCRLFFESLSTTPK